VVDVYALSGAEFERVIGALLERMGYRVEITKQSGDGGIDIIAGYNRPIIGGRYLIQCKRLAAGSLVGSPTVRDLYGAVAADQKAMKGVLITTSGFTDQAQAFASGLRIELIDGEQLRKLLTEFGTT
jgi:restriction system protein